jgi:hypothetical protein
LSEKLAEIKKHLTEGVWYDDDCYDDMIWLVDEVEQLRERNLVLKIYEAFGQDHGHEQCVAEIKRLKESHKR